MSDEELAERLMNITVVARARPMDKSRLVKIAQSKEMVAGMTGDGVNDSAALKKVCRNAITYAYIRTGRCWFCNGKRI